MAKGTPWEAFTGKQPNFDFLRIYGSDAYAHIEDKFRNKFDSKSKKLVLVGYEPKSRAYRLWERGTKNVYVRCNVKICESQSLETVIFDEENNVTECLRDDPEEQKLNPTQEISNSDEEEEGIASRTRSKQSKNKNEQVIEKECIAHHTRSKDEEINVISCMLAEMPKDYDEAIKTPDRKQGRKRSTKNLSVYKRIILGN